MSDNKLGKEILISDTLVPDIFITQYIQELSKDAICLYMWLLMLVREKSFSIQEIELFGALSESDRNEAFSELLLHNLVDKKDDKSFVLADIKLREVEEYITARKYSSDSLGDSALSSDKDRDMLAGSINKTFYLGKMSYLNYRLIDKCLYEYKFDSAVIYSLFDYAVKAKKQYVISFLQNTAEQWFKKGYTTPDKLKVVIDKDKRVSEIIKLLGKLMRKRIDGVDIEKIEMWVSEYDVTSDLVELAYRRNDFRGTITVRNVGDKLKEWYLADIKSIDQAIVYEDKRREENKAKSSRKKSRSNSWKTGGEMGITGSMNTNDTSAFNKPVDDTNDDDDDEILNLFGGSDEDN